MNQSPNLNENPFPKASKPGKNRRKYVSRNNVLGEVDYDYDRDCELHDAESDPSEVPHCDRLLGLALVAVNRYRDRKTS